MDITYGIIAAIAVVANWEWLANVWAMGRFVKVKGVYGRRRGHQTIRTVAEPQVHHLLYYVLVARKRTSLSNYGKVFGLPMHFIVWLKYGRKQSQGRLELLHGASCGDLGRVDSPQACDHVRHPTSSSRLVV